MDLKHVKRRKGREITTALNKKGITRCNGRPRGESTLTLPKKAQRYLERKNAAKAAACLQSPSELLAVINTWTGKKRFPELAEKLVSDPTRDAVLDATLNLVKSSGRSVKPRLIRALEAI